MLLHEYLEFFAREEPEAPCVEMGELSYSYSGANNRCNRLAHAMLATQMHKGDRLNWLSKNCLDQMFAFYAGSKIGVVHCTCASAPPTSHTRSTATSDATRARALPLTTQVMAPAVSAAAQLIA